MTVRHYLRRFVRKFVFDVLPGALASLVGAMFFAQHWAQPAPVAAPRAANADRLALQSEQITRMVRQEHALMVEFLKREQERDAARRPLSINEMKAKDAAVARRAAAEPVRVAKATPVTPAVPVPVPPSRPKSAAAPLPPAKPAGNVVAIESGPRVAPEAERPGVLAGVSAWAFAWADRAVDATGLRQIPAIVRTIKGGTDALGSEFQTISDARLIGAEQ